MTVTLEREIGALRADVQNLTHHVNRLIDKLDQHDTSDNHRFTAIELALANHEGGKAVFARWRLMAHHFVSIAGGGALGAVLSRWTGAH